MGIISDFFLHNYGKHGKTQFFKGKSFPNGITIDAIAMLNDQKLCITNPTGNSRISVIGSISASDYISSSPVWNNTSEWGQTLANMNSIGPPT